MASIKLENYALCTRAKLSKSQFNLTKKLEKSVLQACKQPYEASGCISGYINRVFPFFVEDSVDNTVNLKEFSRPCVMLSPHRAVFTQLAAAGW